MVKQSGSLNECKAGTVERGQLVKRRPELKSDQKTACDAI